MHRSLYHAGTSRTVCRDKGEQDETPGLFETPGSPRSHGHAYCANRFGEDDNNGLPPGGNVKGRYECGRDIHVSQRRGGVQWIRVDQTGHILDDGTGVLRCQLDFMI